MTSHRQNITNHSPYLIPPHHHQTPSSHTNQTKKIQNYQFNMNQMIGKGNFSKVYKAVNQITKQIFAVKVIQFSTIKNNELAQLLYSQIDVLKQLKHPNILNCIQIFTSANNCYIIAELCNEGDLQSKIKQKGNLDQKQAKKIIWEVYQGLKYLSEHNIVHRDIKLANIFLKNGIAKIADFGFAKKIAQPFKDINIGSPIYMSPQGIIDNIYGPKTDIWAFGIFIYQMLHGYTPLAFCKTEADLKFHILKPLGQQRIKPTISNDLRDLIFKCLDIDVNRRISMKEMQKHPFIQKLIVQFQTKNKLNLNFDQIKTPYYQTLPFAKTTQGFRKNSNQSMEAFAKTITPQIIVKNSMRQNNLLPPKDQPKFVSQSPKYNPNQKVFTLVQTQRNTINYEIIKNDVIQTKRQDSQDKKFKVIRGLSVNKSKQNILIPKNNKKLELVKGNSQQFEKKNQYWLSPQKKKSINNVQKQNSQKIIFSYIKFEQCIQLLHYCRLIFKTINLIGKNQRTNTLFISTIQNYSNWLLDVISQIQRKIPYYVKFQGQKAGQRQKKLREVIKQYSNKYNRQLKYKNGLQINLQRIQLTTLNMLDYLQTLINSNSMDKKQLIMMYCHLGVTYETNKIIQRCIKCKNYNEISKQNNLQIFLTNKKELGQINNYLDTKHRIFQNVYVN